MTIEQNAEALRRSYADLLGLDAPIPEPALWAIADDPTYARRLFACRSAPQVMSLMLDHPPQVSHAQANSDLVTTAATALARWAASGFATVDENQIAARLSACQACPHLTAARSPLQKLAGLAAPDSRICALCGCNVARKTRLATEHCPDQHPDHANLTRWGEAHPKRLDSEPVSIS